MRKQGKKYASWLERIRENEGGIGNEEEMEMGMGVRGEGSMKRKERPGEEKE